MAVQLICCSHSPLMMTDIEESRQNIQADFRAEMDRMSAELHRFSPDLVVIFGPDHFNGFFFEMMPPFCVGLAAEGSRDWGLEGGPLRVPKSLALDCATELLGRDIDVAVSHDMKIDHGMSIPLMQLTGSLARYDVLPFFINCAAAPRPSMRRARQLGAAVGKFLADRHLRVSIIGSGGLSHDPPTPRLDRTSHAVAQRLIKGTQPTTEELQAREARVMRAARDLVAGKGPCMPPNETWDRRFMQHIIDGDFAAMDAINDAEIDRHAGFGGHEVRTWVAAAAAAEALGAQLPSLRHYAVIPEWLTGMGIVTAEAA